MSEIVAGVAVVLLLVPAMVFVEILVCGLANGLVVVARWWRRATTRRGSTDGS